jgi:RNA ligase (TIGR02306 family)
MSSLIVEVTKVVELKPIENADRLELVIIKGWQCVVPKDQYHVGDLVIYVPIDAVFPQPLSDKIGVTKYLSRQRVKTAKLRGTISQGVIMSVDEVPGAVEGQDVAEALGITKWEPPLPGQCTAGQPRPQHPDFLRYTDIENIKNYPDVLTEGEEVVITEKIHGTNFRAANIAKEVTPSMLVEGVNQAGLHAGSHRMDFVDTPENLYWNAARKYKLADILPPGYQIFGEIYGRGVQKLTYDLEDFDVRFFDLMKDLKYVDYDDFVAFCNEHSLPVVPEMYRGPWDKHGTKMADGQSFIAKHIREGFVVKPVKERWDHKVGRVILKAISEKYLLKDFDDGGH